MLLYLNDFTLVDIGIILLQNAVYLIWCDFDKFLLYVSSTTFLTLFRADLTLPHTFMSLEYERNGQTKVLPLDTYPSGFRLHLTGVVSSLY